MAAKKTVYKVNDQLDTRDVHKVNSQRRQTGGVMGSTRLRVRGRKRAVLREDQLALAFLLLAQALLADEADASELSDQKPTPRRPS